MPQKRGRTTLRPRREAGPIRKMEQLTEEQRSAGDQASALLHAMAGAPPPPRRPIPEARRFLPVIDEVRTNHVVLLDGRRGSGKSALLLTLLTGYSETLLNGQPFAEFEDWFNPSDRIVPVGLVDLQPQPASTNLLLLLVACLERVVHVLWPQRERGKPGAQPWHVPAPDEPESLKLWSNFVRVAASSGGGNAQDRKKILDPEAFALEQMKEDMRRLDLPSVFREFMDALTQDYLALTHQNSGPPPLFLLAIDDADMNPWLSAGLLEVLRKLYHPRLAFLLTGDSSLFVEMQKQELTRDVQRDSRVLTDEEKKRFELLALEIYAKVIPQGHRCELPSLLEGERLSALPDLEGFLDGISIQPRTGVNGDRLLSLRDYLRYGSQVREALPERLRTLWDLYGELTRTDEQTKQKGHAKERAATAIETFWHSVVRDAQLTQELESNLRQMIHRSRSARSQLWIEDGFASMPSVRIWNARSANYGWQLIVETPERFNLTFRGVELDPKMTSAVILATNFAADDERGVFASRSPAILNSETPVFAHGTGLLAQQVRAIAPWPIPAWSSFEDLYEMKARWEINLTSGGGLDLLARRFLASVLAVGSRPRFDEHRTLTSSEREEAAGSEPDNAPLEWGVLAERLVELSRMDYVSPRQLTMATWAFSQAGILAAPEAGLPAEVANKFLKALRAAFGKDWERARVELRKARRVCLSVHQLHDDSDADKHSWIQHLDEVFRDHQFGDMVEKQASQSHLAGLVDEFRNMLNTIRVRWLSSIVGNSSEQSLIRYLTPYRMHLLQFAPASFFESAKKALLRYQNISGDATPALMALWRVACETIDANDFIRNAVKEEGGRISIEQRLLSTISIDDRMSAIRSSLEPGLRPTHLLISSRLHAEVSAIHVWALRSRTDELAPLLEAILRMVNDYKADQEGRKIPLLFSDPQSWLGARFSYLDHHYFPWVIPNWQTLLEKETLESAWNERMVDMESASPSRAPGAGGPYVDALAYWLVRSSQLLFSRSTLERELNIELRPYDWEHVVKPFSRSNSKLDEVHKSRESVLDGWLRELPLLAAPECGLSHAAAAAILASTAEHFSESDTAYADWRKRREKRLEKAGIPKESVKGFLRNIDNEQKDHPWVVLMQKLRRPRSNDAE